MMYRSSLLILFLFTGIFCQGQKLIFYVTETDPRTDVEIINTNAEKFLRDGVYFDKSNGVDYELMDAVQVVRTLKSENKQFDKKRKKIRIKKYKPKTPKPKKQRKVKCYKF